MRSDLHDWARLAGEPIVHSQGFTYDPAGNISPRRGDVSIIADFRLSIAD
jgi:hypothetical protein